jgi:ABC-type Fe3+-citrate transport system substrate-binding protein
MKKLTKIQKIISISAILVALALLVFGCGNAVSNEVKTDSTINDTTLVDSVKIDTIGKN